MTFSGTFTAGGQVSDAILNRVGESIRFTLTGSWTGIMVLEKSTNKEGWKIIRVMRGNFDTSTKNNDPQHCYLRLRCLSLVTGSADWALEDVEDEFIYEQFLRDGTQAIGVTDAGDLYVLGELFSGGGGGSITIQTDQGTYPVGSLFTFTSSDASVVITGDETTDEIDFTVDFSDYTTTAALTTLLAGKEDTITTLGVAKGGTGIGSYTAGDLLYATGATTLAKLAKGTSLQQLRMNAGATAPEWATIAGGGDVTGPASSTANAQSRFSGTGGKTLKDGKWIEDDDGRITVNIGNTSSGATYGTYLTATLTGTASGIHAAERLDLTSAGSGAGAFVLGRWVRLLGGYTGGGMCVGDWVFNTCASTGTDLNGGGGNMGYRVSMGGTTTGHKAAYYATVTGAGSRTFGSLIDIEVGPSSGVSVGYSTSVNPGSGTLVSACFYGKLTGTVGQVPNTSGAAVFDNAATTHPILVLQDNGTTCFEFADGGVMTAGATGGTPTHRFNTATATAGSDALTFTNGPSGTAGNPDIYWTVNINGTNYAFPGFAV